MKPQRKAMPAIQAVEQQQPNAKSTPAPERPVGLHNKIIRVMELCAYVQKDKRNDKQHYSYVSDEAIVERVNDALVEVGVATYPIKVDVVQTDDVRTANGGTMERIKVKMLLEFVDADSKETKVVEMLGCGMDSGDKAASKAETNARKYIYKVTFNIATGDDPEADESVDEATAPPSAAAPANQVQRSTKPREYIIGQGPVVRFPWGEGLKGRPISEGTDQDLVRLQNWLEQQLDKPGNSFREKNQTDILAIKAELSRRRSSRSAPASVPEPQPPVDDAPHPAEQEELYATDDNEPYL